MRKRYISVMAALMLAASVALASSSMASAESSPVSVQTSDYDALLNTGSSDVAFSESEDEPKGNDISDSDDASSTQEYMSFDSSIEFIATNKVTAQIMLTDGNSELSKCSVIFAITFDGQEYPCEIVSPSGQHYVRSSVHAYNTEEIVGLGTVAYYRIDSVELGTYTITSTEDSNIFNCSVDMGLSNDCDFMIDTNGQLDDSRTGNVMTQEEYDALVEEVAENEATTDTANNKDIITQNGVNLEGVTGDIDTSNGEIADDIESFEEELERQLEELENNDN